MRDLLCTGYHADLIQCADLGAQTTVDTEHLAIDDSSQCHEIEDLTACFPHRSTSVFLETFLVEPIDLGNLSRLVVATDQCNAIGVSAQHKISNAHTTNSGEQYSLGLETEQQG